MSWLLDSLFAKKAASEAEYEVILDRVIKAEEWTAEANYLEKILPFPLQFKQDDVVDIFIFGNEYLNIIVGEEDGVLFAMPDGEGIYSPSIICDSTSTEISYVNMTGAMGGHIEPQDTRLYVRRHLN